MKLKLSLLFTVLLSSILFAQKRTINGTVSSESDVMYGVSISEKNTTNGTTTDFDGSYYIKVDENATLVFSYLGYETQEVDVLDSTKIDVILKEMASQLDEVVILGFGDVVGQARRRAESIQDTPESVVTYTSETIESKGIENLKTFTDYIPNVNFTSSFGIGNNFITVRGISHIRNGESPIAFVIDGVTLPDANLINQELFDIALIEMVKGPQGALYGKNAIAGAVNILTNKPTNSFKNKVLFGYGSGNLFKVQAITSGPIVKDKLFYRLSASSRKGDGVIYNDFLNRPVDFTDELIVRGQIKANLSDRTNLTLTAQVLDSKAGGSYFASPINDETPGDGVGNAQPDNFDNFSIVADQFGESSLKGFYGNGKLEFNLDDVKIVSSTTINKGDRSNFGDFDYTNIDQLRQRQDSDSDTFNQEIKISSVATDSKVSWDLGVFYQNSDKLLYSEVTADFGFFTPPTFQPTGEQTTLAVGNFTNTYKTLAAFGFLDFKASDKLTFSFGLRFDNDNITQENAALNFTPERTDSELQPKASIAFQASDDVLLYTNYGRGYRSGGFNQDESNGAKLSYEPELTNNYEFGIKNSFWDDRFILNASAYYVSFENQQQFRLFIGSDGNIRQDIRNFEESKSYGFETDIRLRASKYFDIYAGYGLSKSEIQKGTSVYSNTGETFDVAGKNTPFIPQNSFVVGLESKFNVSKKTVFNGNVLLKGTGDIYWHEDNEAVSSAYNLLNSKLGFTFNDKLSVFFWGNNILGEEYITEFFGEPFSSGGKDVVWKGDPATFGVSLGYDF